MDDGERCEVGARCRPWEVDVDIEITVPSACQGSVLRVFGVAQSENPGRLSFNALMYICTLWSTMINSQLISMSDLLCTGATSYAYAILEFGALV